jgi:outer membrane protein
MKFKYSVVIVLGLVSLQSLAQTTRLTLQQALDLSIKNSKELAISKDNVSIAEAKLAQARDQMWPEIKASGTYLRVNAPTITMSNPGEGSGGSGSGSPLAAFANLNSIGLAQLTVSEPLFAGFRIRNNSIMQKYLGEAAKYDHTTTTAKVISTTAQAVFQYYQLLETRKLLAGNLKQAEQRVTEFKNLEAQGLLARNDRLKAELQLNNIQLTHTEVSNTTAIAAYNLQILLALPEGSAIELDTTGMFVRPTIASEEQLQQQSETQRAELKAAHLRTEAQNSAVKIAKASRYPSIALSGGYVNAYIPNVLTVTNALNGGIGIQYNLTGALHGKHVVQEARSRQHQAALTEQITADKVKIDVRQKFLNYRKSLEKLAITETAIEQAQENFSISKNKFSAGLMILSDYLEADVALLQAQINRATAKAESMIAYYELQESTGNLK